jgi:hypothetical protein
MMGRGWTLYVLDDVAWFGFGRHGEALHNITLNGMVRHGIA